VVIGLEPDADLLSRHRSLSSLVSSVPATGTGTACLRFSTWPRVRPCRPAPPPRSAGLSADPRGRACRPHWAQHKTVVPQLVGGTRRVRRADRVSSPAVTQSRCGRTPNHRNLTRRRDSIVKAVCRTPATRRSNRTILADIPRSAKSVVRRRRSPPDRTPIGGGTGPDQARANRITARPAGRGRPR
jgi:hypothetical protein